MSRVPWTVLGGGEVETLLSNLIYNFSGQSLRIRPSRGDYGIDVIIPAPSDPQMWDVHQIKKFADNLSASQKSQVEKSFGRALVGMVRRNVPLNDWYLVMPLDPTLDNLQDWFDEMPGRAIEALATDTDLALTAPEVEQIEAWRSAPGRVIGWKALDFCEKLAADYPYVVDYYLFGGRERIKDAVAELAKLIGRDDQLRASDPGSDSETQVASRDAALLQPGEVREHLSRLGRVLDTDPHFRYGFGLDINRPELHLEDGLVAASQEAIPGDLWLTFKIYERSAQSLEERPIPIQLEFEFEEESDEHQAFRDWIKYGKPAEAPATITADLPGQLKRGPMTGTVSLPPQNESPESCRLRLRVVTPDATELAQLNFTMRSTRGLTNTAAWVSGTDDSGHLAISMLVDNESRSGTINFQVSPIANSVAARVLPVLSFASKVVAPNVLQVAREFGPFTDFSPLPSPDPLVEPAVERIVQALAVIQTRTSQPVLVPDFSDYTHDDFQAIRRVASLIEGRTVVRKWTDYTFRKNPDADIPVGSHWQMILGDRLRLGPITGEAELGLVEQHVGSVTIEDVTDNQVRCVPHQDDTVHMVMVDQLPAGPPGEMVVRCRRLPDDADQQQRPVGE